MGTKTNSLIKIYPWYHGLTGDLLFYIAIDTLFLTLVKNLSAAQIVSLSSLSQFICIALQFPILFVIKRIGNTASFRVGAGFLLLSALTVTFCKSYYLLLLSRVFHDVAAIFRSASVVALENSLELADRRSDFVKVRTQGNTIYSTITMLISFVASYMFNLNHFLPMIGCITTCSLGLILSFLMKDTSAYNKITPTRVKQEKLRFNYGTLIILALVVYALFYPLVNEGQSVGKLFLQQELFLDFDAEKTALIIGIVVCISRITRVFANLIFARLYRTYQNKVGVALPMLLGIALACQLFGSMIPAIVVKICVMGLGYIIILFARDPFRLYMQDVILGHTPKEQHQTLLTMMEFGVKIGTAGIGLAFSAILVNHPISLVVTIMLAIILVQILLSIKLYQMIRASIKTKTT